MVESKNLIDDKQEICCTLKINVLLLPACLWTNFYKCNEWIPLFYSFFLIQFEFCIIAFRPVLRPWLLDLVLCLLFKPCKNDPHCACDGVGHTPQKHMLEFNIVLVFGS